MRSVPEPSLQGAGFFYVERVIAVVPVLRVTRGVVEIDFGVPTLLELADSPANRLLQIGLPCARSALREVDTVARVAMQDVLEQQADQMIIKLAFAGVE